MVSTDLFNLFVCKPCRQIVQFFDASADAQPGAAYNRPGVGAVQPLTAAAVVKPRRSAAAQPARSRLCRSG